MKADAVRGVDSGLKEYLFCESLVHGYRAAQGIWARVADAEQVECGLQFSVFTLAAVKTEESDVSQTAQLDDIRPEETVGLIRTGCFYSFQIRFLPADVSCDLESVAGHGEYIFQILRRFRKPHKYIQQECIVSFFKQCSADSGCGDE